MHFDAFRCPSHHLCSFIKARAEIWRGGIPTNEFDCKLGEFDCKCGDSDEREFSCWCHCSNGVLKQGKFNRKGEKVIKHEYRFLHH